MTVAGLREVNGIIKAVKGIGKVIHYKIPTDVERGSATIVVFTDAGFPHKGLSRGLAQ